MARPLEWMDQSESCVVLILRQTKPMFWRGEHQVLDELKHEVCGRKSVRDIVRCSRGRKNTLRSNG